MTPLILSVVFSRRYRKSAAAATWNTDQGPMTFKDICSFLDCSTALLYRRIRTHGPHSQRIFDVVETKYRAKVPASRKPTPIPESDAAEFASLGCRPRTSNLDRIRPPGRWECQQLLIPCRKPSAGR